MPPDRQYVRTPIDAAATARRFGHDYQLADRLDALGVKSYKSDIVRVRVDLASEASLVEPMGRPLVNHKLFNTQAAAAAWGWMTEIEAFSEKEQPKNIVAITLRAPRNLVATKGGPRSLDADGYAPIENVRFCQTALNNLVQRAVAELERLELLVPLLVVRHVRPIKGGASFDQHVHLTASVNPKNIAKVQEIFVDIFGGDRVWNSGIEHPDEKRDFVATSSYGPWRLANTDWNQVDNDHLVEFHKQITGLRSVEALGPFREFRAPQADASSLDSLVEKYSTDDVDDVDESNGRDVPSADPADAPAFADTSTQPAVDESTTSGDTASVAACLDGLPVASVPVPVIHYIGFAWIALTRRYICTVSNFTTFHVLRSHYPELDAHIEFAKAHVESTHRYLFQPAKPENPSSYQGSQSGHDQSALTGSDRTPSPTTPETSDLKIGAERQGDTNQTSMTPDATATASSVIPVAADSIVHDRPHDDGRRADENPKDVPPDPAVPVAADSIVHDRLHDDGRRADGNPKEVPPDPAVTVAPAMPEETQTGTEPLAASLAGIERSDQRLLPDPAPIPREPDLRFKLELAVRATGEATATVTVAVPAAVLGCFGNASRQPITL
jgi:hypothetical protein